MSVHVHGCEGYDMQNALTDTDFSSYLSITPPSRCWQLPSDMEPVLIKAGLQFYWAVSNLTHTCWYQAGQTVAEAFEDNPKEISSDIGLLSLLYTGGYPVWWGEQMAKK